MPTCARCQPAIRTCSSPRDSRHHETGSPQNAQNDPQRILVKPDQEYDIQRNSRRTGISVSHVNFEIRRALNLMRSELKDYLPSRTDHPAALVQVVKSTRKATRSSFQSFSKTAFLLLTPSACLLLLYNTNTWTIFYCRNT